MVTQNLPLFIVQTVHCVHLNPTMANFKPMVISKHSKQRDSGARFTIGEVIFLDYLLVPAHYTLSSWKNSEEKMPDCSTNFVTYLKAHQGQIDLLLAYLEVGEETFTHYFMSVSCCYSKVTVTQFRSFFNCWGILELLGKTSRQNFNFLHCKSR